MRATKRAVLGAVVAAAAAFGAVVPAAAAPPLLVSFPVEEEFYLPGLSGACGFETWLSIEGTVMLRLFTDQDGTPRFEVDGQSNFMVTIFRPATGASLTYPNATVSRWIYSDGAAIGSEVLVTLTGLGERVGNLSTAGRWVFLGEVVGYSDDGFPFVDFTNLLSIVGRDPGSDAVRAAICSALA
jgi:hypothetical protein